MNTVEKKFAREKKVFNTYSFTLFGGQGLLGCIFAAAWQAVNVGFSDGFTYNLKDEAVYGFVDGLIAMCMGIGFGLLAGIFVLLFSSHEYKHHFTDYSYWLPSDGIRFSGDENDDEEYEAIEHSKIKHKHAYI